MTESSFVRVGAMVRCTSCRQTFRVAKAHVTRLVGADNGGASDPLLGEAEGQAAGDAPTPPDQSPVQGQPVDPADEEPVQGEPVTAEPTRLTGDPGVERLRRLARRQSHRRSHRALLLLAGGLGGIVVAMALILWLANTNGPAGESSNHLDAPTQADPAPPAEVEELGFHTRTPILTHAAPRAHARPWLLS